MKVASDVIAVMTDFLLAGVYTMRTHIPHESPGGTDESEETGHSLGRLDISL